jgi:hypothetical protein
VPDQSASDRSPCQPGGGDGRGARAGAARQEGFLDAGGDRPRQIRRGRCLRVGRQYRRADGDRALRSENPARHRPSRHCRGDADDQGPCAGARHGRQRRLYRRAPAAVRHHGRDAGVGGRAQAEPQRRPAEYRRGRHQGQRSGEAGRRTAARQPSQLPRQRRGRRHLQGHHRRRRVRRLCRQCHPEGFRRPGQDDRHHAARRVQAQC